MEMTPDDLRFLAMPRRPLRGFPESEHNLALAARLYRRAAGRSQLRLETAIGENGSALPLRRFPRAHRKISGRGIIEGTFDWPRRNYVQSFTDWTFYGHTSGGSKERSDAFVLTRDFVAHGQHDLDGSPILPKVAGSRYGTPVYRLNGDLTVLPIYLRKNLGPPRSAHEILAHRADHGPQLELILRLLEIDASAQPVLTWLPPENYL